MYTSQGWRRGQSGGLAVHDWPAVTSTTLRLLRQSHSW